MIARSNQPIVDNGFPTLRYIYRVGNCTTRTVAVL